MRQIATEMNRGKEGAEGMGVQVVDVRLTQTDLVPQVRDNVFARMKSERKQVAAEIRAKGDEEATKIRAEADRQKTIIIAEAEEKAQKIKGDGEAKRAALYSASYGKNAEFAAFYRSMQAYEKAIPAGTQMIVPPDGEFFRYLRAQNGQGRR
jgi:membrane protease subunit HflC